MTRWQKIEAEIICDTQGEGESKALLDTLSYIVVKVKTDVLVDTTVVKLA